jgi:hypothetical protein
VILHLEKVAAKIDLLVFKTTLSVTPVDSITGGVRLSWTLNEFYASGGVVSFTDRVAFALGIHAS